MKNTLIKFIVAVFAVAMSVIGLSSLAFAHHSVVTGTPARPCGVDQPWSASFHANSDADYGKDWQSKYKIDSGSYNAFGSWADDQVTYGPFNIGPFAANKASVTVTVSSQWGRKTDHTKDTAAAETAYTINRPAATTCPVPPTTTAPPTTTTTPPTNTQPPVTAVLVTTVPETTVPETSATVPEFSTTEAPTTTVVVEMGAPPVPPTTEFVPVAPEVLNTTELPATGSSNTGILVWAFTVLTIGGAICIAARRQTR